MNSQELKAYVEKHREMAIDKLSAATYGLWNALLTVNGVVLAVFGAFPGNRTPRDSDFVHVILLAAILSSCFLILNYVMRKTTYYRMVQLLADMNHQLSGDEIKRDNYRAVTRHKWVACSENIAIFLFLVEAVCIVIFAWSRL
ncbi:MAG: hypothetical protein PHW12_09120 [Smithella sp.]|nr:hypothetical protein [Smithella sp.]